jgi:NADP-dependent 3-hydroxy acid dehydrogenase YdfG
VDLDRLDATVRDQKGRIDVLFANAGVVDFGPLGEITEEHFDWIFDINARGLLFSVEKALLLFREGGSIILNASIRDLPSMRVYSAVTVCEWRVTSVQEGSSGENTSQVRRSDTPAMRPNRVTCQYRSG